MISAARAAPGAPAQRASRRAAVGLVISAVARCVIYASI
jgi:hypothetical protein